VQIGMLRLGGSLHYQRSPLGILRLRLDTRDIRCRHSRCTGQQWRYGRFPPVRHQPTCTFAPFSRQVCRLIGHPSTDSSCPDLEVLELYVLAASIALGPTARLPSV